LGAPFPSLRASRVCAVKPIVIAPEPAAPAAHLDLPRAAWHHCRTGIAAPAQKDGIGPLTHFLKSSFAAFALTAFAFLSPAVAQQDTAQDQEVVKETHGDWEVVCSAAQPKECIMRQIGKTAEGKAVMVIRIRKLEGVKSQDGKEVPGAIHITTPLGTLLRTGVKVQIDAGEPRAAGFEVCVPGGCIMREPMSEEFLSSLRGGKVAKATFNLVQKGPLTIEISLKGFTKAFKAL
jgi:invasion protein IalB